MYNYPSQVFVWWSNYVFKITLSNLHLSMYYYFYILFALNPIFYINFVLVLYIYIYIYIYIYNVFIVYFILISIYLWPVLYLMALCGACCRLHEHENKWNEMKWNHIMGWQFTSNQGWPETCGGQVKLNNLASLEPDVL